MSRLAERMPHIMTLPRALGTGMIIRSAAPLDDATRGEIRAFAAEYERLLSRFRPDSLVAAMRGAEHGGTFDFPEWAVPLFDLYDRLADATDGAIDPCVGEDLTRLGYGADLRFVMEPDAAGHLGSLRGRPTWRGDVERHGATLVTKRPVSLDFGACGKGYLVDLIAALIGESAAIDDPHGALLIDAGGDLLVRSPEEPVTIALEDPWDSDNAVGVAAMSGGAFCASAPSRRQWGQAAGHRLHHLINAIDGRPADDVAAAWVAVAAGLSAEPTATQAAKPRTMQAGSPTAARTGKTLDEPSTAWAAESHGKPPAKPRVEPLVALADGLATALFVSRADRLRARFAFDCAIVRSDRTAAVSPRFPGRLFACDPRARGPFAHDTDTSDDSVQ
ncbi:thiamine biosynthesis protein ApbE [Bifidobacterium lemurum]|uniref:FAD:protein FMN transferase n=1 Tax=Bifidobacterium lemurum TaxID=1603886 RepID=A0A261FUI1_9BIFI|nr:FAD:protein FMN transferase [Bifidobacterium lemurum]OZG62844.1 thiamine biosynthesis protein ApbE [Bifidobacterium lemurum]QOL35173.1 FAD:protein FMN transferase [Bifidobacterium lemurum]